jgi:hypothetical protein
MLLALHQPNYLPYFGNFHKMAHADLFIFFDNVPIGQGKSWASRNRVNLQGQETWLTVPIYKSGRVGQLIQQVEVRWDMPWARKHLRTIEAAYRKSPYVEEVSDLLRRTYEANPKYLADLNVTLIQGIAHMLNLPCRFARASDRVHSDSRGTDMILEVCQAFGCTDYLTGTAYDRFEAGQIENAGIHVYYQELQHPVYASLGGPFIPSLSIVDMILSVGPQQVSRWLSMPQGSVPLDPVEKV